MLAFKVLYVGKHSMRSDDNSLNFIRNVLHIIGYRLCDVFADCAFVKRLLPWRIRND